MKIASSLAVLLLLIAPITQAQVAQNLWDYPEMSPEHCAELPPEQLYDRLMAANPHLPGISSEGGQDYFCLIYQRQLQKFVDARYPRARTYRQPITDAFLEAVRYVEEIYHHDAIKHLYERTSADAEWQIYQAEKDDWQLWRKTSYGPREIEQLALLMADANGYRDRTFQAQALPHLQEALRQFAIATTDQNGDQDIDRRNYLGSALIKFLSNLM